MQFWTKYFQSKYFHRGGKKGEEQEQEQEEDPKQRTVKGKGKEKVNAATVRVKRGSYTLPDWPLVEPWLRLTQRHAEEDLRKRLGEIDLSSDLTRSDETGLGAKVRHHGFSHFGELGVYDCVVCCCCCVCVCWQLPERLWRGRRRSYKAKGHQEALPPAEDQPTCHHGAR
jgi:hypothetical protein